MKERAVDPVITPIVLALAAGAAAGFKSTASQAVTDAYNGLKALIQHKYSGVDVTPLEKKPDSDAKRTSLAEDLTEAGAGQDQELLTHAQALLTAVQAHNPSAAAAIGIDLDHVKAAFLKAQTVIAEGTGVKVTDAEFTGGIDLGEVRAGNVGGGGGDGFGQLTASRSS